ncbi:MAG: hypothetical protein GY928_37425 [Colwellia sp.]|nr:hypothetical protein [Colwellia sp.]
MKKRVTKHSLRVGQTVYELAKMPFGEWKMYNTPIVCNDTKGWMIYTLQTSNYFYSKKKAKTKMNKLNKERG